MGKLLEKIDRFLDHHLGKSLIGAGIITTVATFSALYFLQSQPNIIYKDINGDGLQDKIIEKTVFIGVPIGGKVVGAYPQTLTDTLYGTFINGDTTFVKRP